LKNKLQYQRYNISVNLIGFYKNMLQGCLSGLVKMPVNNVISTSVNAGLVFNQVFIYFL